MSSSGSSEASASAVTSSGSGSKDSSTSGTSNKTGASSNSGSRSSSSGSTSASGSSSESESSSSTYSQAASVVKNGVLPRSYQVILEERVTKSGKNSRLEWAACEMQGWRPTMEDARICHLDLSAGEVSCDLFAIFDGHGGAEVSQLCSREFPHILKHSTQFKEGDFGGALVFAIEEIDRRIVKKEREVPEIAGACAVVLLLTEEEAYVANVGDSRCVFGVDGKTVAMTADQKPSVPGEKYRIEAAGSFVDLQEDRVDGILAMSRAIGDVEFKENASLPPRQQAVIATPEVRVIELSEKIEFIILGCDGIYELLDNDAVVTWIREKFVTEKKLTKLAKGLAKKCLAKDKGAQFGLGEDNMSLILIQLKGDLPDVTPKPRTLDIGVPMRAMAPVVHGSAPVGTSAADRPRPTTVRRGQQKPRSERTRRRRG